MARKRRYARKSGFYREAPFWSWNDVLDKREAIRQIDEMAAGGWGGFFMHARPGLVTDYMGSEWMSVIRACVAHAKKRGMCAYLYDENRWPSGFAGGEVPRKGEKYRSKFLMLSENLAEEGSNYKWLASFAVRTKGKEITARRVERGQAAPAGAKACHLYQYTMGLGNEWFLGSAYVDLLAPETTREFIRVTHERYRAAVGKEFGDTVPAIFTDEPSLPFAENCPGPSVPWTPSLPQVFRKRCGYDIMGHLLSLFMPLGDYRKVRYDFYRTVSEMFVENFAKQIYDWCEKNDIALTGHMMAEDNLRDQMRFSCGAMPFYEYFQMPGMDHLGKNIDDPATAKQLSSVADQLGKERVLSELYGCSGQDMNLKGRKWIADWHFALGVNLLNPHLWLYTMRGARKRDFPPTISYQQPHWKKSKGLSDRNALLSYLLTRGRRVVDVLVVHPIESGWCVTTPLEPNALAGIDGSFAALVDTLLAEHVDFHFGDESLVGKYGAVRDGKLAVGKGRYSVAVVAETLTLRRSTANLLARFAAEGGKILVVNRRPALVEGAKADGALLRSALSTGLLVPTAKVARAIRAVSAQPVEIVGANAGKVIYHLREVGGERLLFAANTDPDAPAAVNISLRGGERFAAQLSLVSGEPAAVVALRKGGRLTVKVDLAEAASAVFLFGAKPYRAGKAVRGGAGGQIPINGKWTVSRMDENALTLDRVRLPHKSHGWTGPEYVLFAAETLKNAGGTARARYEFEVETMPEGAVHFALERPGRWKIFVNGQAVASRPRGFFVDTEFRRIDIRRHVRPGRNVVEIQGKVTKDFELESAYLVGRFGVYRRNGRFAIGGIPKSADPRDLGGQGLAFFAGAVEIEKEVLLERRPKAARFGLGKLYAGAAEFVVNGRAQGDLLWPPYEVNVKGLRKGKNRVTLRLFSTLRNLLGPHHFEGPEILWASPRSFVDRKRWSDEYRFMPFGIRGAVLTVT